MLVGDDERLIQSEGGNEKYIHLDQKPESF